MKTRNMTFLIVCLMSWFQWDAFIQSENTDRMQWLNEAKLEIYAKASEKEGLLKTAYQESQFENALLPLEKWNPYPNINNRDFWDSVPENIKNEYISRANKEAGMPWPQLTAMGYLEFAINGNRTNYEHLLKLRQNRLFTLVLAELFENKGTYLHDIVNGLWAFAEESSWTWPAATPLQAAGVGLPDFNEPIPDLGAGVKAAALAWINFLLQPRLDSISPLISQRIETEIRRRFMTPVFERKDLWWMGYTSSRPPNNWNPWIISNYISCVLLLEEDRKLQARHLYKACEMLDHFIGGYTEYGGCDEGPGYWKHAVGSLFNSLELIYLASGGRLSVFNEKKIANMGDYFPAMQISGNNFVNFADASRTIDLSAYKALIYSYGNRTGNSNLMEMALSSIENGNQVPGEFLTHSDFGIGFLRELTFDASRLISNKTPASAYPGFSWYRDIEVVTARDNASSAKGFFLAAKGGHNDESHNHNDIGNFIVYYDGEPLLIDVGVETYTAKTFSPDRYTIWTMQSQYHNLPLINGVMQPNGIDYKALNTRVSNSDSLLVFSLDIAAAYPDSACVDSWKRTIQFKRGDHIEVTDRYQLSQVITPAQWMFISYPEPSLQEDGVIKFRGSARELVFPGDQPDVSIEKIELKDEKLKREWGTDCLYRTVFTNRTTEKSGSRSFIIR